MFLQHLATTGLLQPRNDTNVLKDFSLKAKQRLTLTVVKFLEEPTTPPSVLATQAHVRWAMESVGHTFSLPLEDNEVIEDAIEIYSKWLLGPSKSRPVAIEEDEQAFYRDIFCHFSLLFQDRRLSGTLLDRHVFLCKRVLNIFLSAGRMLGSKLTTATWEVLLKIMLGITDALLQGPCTGQSLGNFLCPQLLRILFELWLLSQTSSRPLWDTLQNFSRHWLHRKWLIQQWNATCISLTRRLIRILYGSTEGTDAVVVNWFDSASTVLTLDKEQVTFSWHRMLHLLGNLGDLNDPEVHLAAMEGLAALTDTFLSIGHSSADDNDGRDVQTNVDRKKSAYKSNSSRNLRKFVRPPDGNSILHIFGPWLFDGAFNECSGFERGRATALGALCRVFSTPGSKFLSAHLGRFYRALQMTLQSRRELRNELAIAAVLQNTGRLFACDRAGARILVPAFISQFDYFLSSANSQPLLRRSCISILNTLLSVASHFLQVPGLIDSPLNPNSPTRGGSNTDSSASTVRSNSEWSAAKTFADLKKMIPNIVGSALSSELDSYNIQMLIWSVGIHIVDDYESAITHPFITHLCNILTNEQESAKWPNAVFRCVFNALATGAPLSPRLKTKLKGTVTYIISRLCYYLDTQLRRLRTSRHALPDVEQLVIAAYQCLLDWVMYSQWVLKEPSLAQCIIQSVMEGVSFKPFFLGTENIIQSAARYVLAHLLSHAGRYPLKSGLTTLSSVISEEPLIKTIMKTETEHSSQYMRCFVLNDNRILTMIENPRTQQTTVIVRDVTGKFGWNSQLAFVARDDSHRTDPKGELREEDDESSSDSEPDNDRQQQQQQQQLLKTVSLLHPTAQPAGVSALLETIDEKTAVVQSLAEEDGATTSVAKLLQEYIQYEQEQPIQPREGSTVATTKSLSLQEESVMNVHDRLEKIMQQQAELETTYLAESGQQEIDPVSIPQCPDKYLGNSKFHLSRLMLSHLGFLSLKNMRQIRLLDHSDQLIQQLNQLDLASERDIFEVSVLYVNESHKEDADLLNAVPENEDFYTFLDSLGWRIDLVEHPAVAAYLDRPAGTLGSCKQMFYYANYCAQLVFILPYLIASSMSDTEKSRLLSGHQVAIVWCEGTRDEDYNPRNFQVTRSTPVQIIVYPLENGLYRIRLHIVNLRSDEPLIGPLQDGMVIPRSMLAPLVRSTVFDICRGGAYRPRFRPYEKRKRLIDNIVKTYAKDAKPSALYASLFQVPPASTVSTSSTAQPPQQIALRPDGRIDLDI